MAFLSLRSLVMASFLRHTTAGPRPSIGDEMERSQRSEAWRPLCPVMRPRGGRPHGVRRWTGAGTNAATARGVTSRGPGAHHLFGPHPLVELLAGHEAQLDRGLAQVLALPVRGLRDLRGLVVADVRVQRGD